MDYASAEAAAALAALAIVSVFGVVTLAVLGYFKWARAQPYRVRAAAVAADPPAIELVSLPPAPAAAAPPASAGEAV